jgi:hypothetical protein
LEIENRPGKIMLATPMTDMLTDRICCGEVEIPPLSVTVLKK